MSRVDYDGDCWLVTLPAAEAARAAGELESQGVGFLLAPVARGYSLLANTPLSGPGVARLQGEAVDTIGFQLLGLPGSLIGGCWQDELPEPWSEAFEPGEFAPPPATEPRRVEILL